MTEHNNYSGGGSLCLWVMLW